MVFEFLWKFLGDKIFGTLDDCEDECDCGDELTLEERQAIMDSWTPPGRYCVRAGGMDYFCDMWKPNAVVGFDLLWTQKIGGEDKVVTGTIFNTDVTIIDYASTITPEVFEHIRQQSFDYVMQMAKEAKAKEDAIKNSKPPCDVNLASYS